ncbi:glycosyltransferase family 39 protein [uncultured Maribacter sp.]|uniref:ArnT family glycosyltransferase n=1 Tax=uncultured Maribacter sp. TaxID=431308 RepID=UPI002612D8E0|nr:glycosyltransferase family 39 protein [uncultured Maribacter sp.]
MNKNIFFKVINSDKLYLKLSLCLFVLYTFSIFLNLNYVPLILEEPRRILVALEMLFHNNFMVTTIFNETWYDHPPLWNIVLAASAKVFGSESEFAFRFPCALSLLLTGILIFFNGKKYVSIKFGILSAFFYLISADLYFFFSTIAEIDIFFSLLILLSILSVFYFYEKENMYLLFLSTYFFGTLGFFTKGVVALVFVGITLLTYFIYKRKFIKLFSFAHILSFCLSIGAIVTYFYFYSLQEDVYTYILDMWSLTQNKTSASGNNPILGLIKHLFTFPLNLVGNLFPATLLLLFIFNKKAIAKIKNHKYIYFLVLAFFFNFIIYWISAGARMRYTYMFYPMVISVLVYIFTFHFSKKSTLLTTYYTILKVIMIIICVAIFVLPFISYLKVNPNLTSLSIGFGLLLFTCLIIAIKTTNPWNKNLFIISFFMVTRLAYSSIVFPIKAVKSSSGLYKKQAKEIALITKQNPIYLLSQETIKEHKEIPFDFYKTAAYLEMQGTRVNKIKSIDKKGFYILRTIDLEKNLLPIYTFTIKKEELNLIKLE